MNVCLYFIIAHGAFQGHATNLIDQSHFNDASTTVIFYNCCWINWCINALNAAVTQRQWWATAALPNLQWTSCNKLPIMMVTLKGKKRKKMVIMSVMTHSQLPEWLNAACWNYVQTFTGFSQSKADCNCLVRGCLPPGDPYLVIEGVKHPKSLDYQLVGASTHYPVIKREKNLLQPLIYPKFLPYFYSATRKRRHSVKHCCNKLFSAF